MFVITDKALKQFQASTEASDAAAFLRISARQSPQGMIYRMGFDEPGADDIPFEMDGMKVIVDPESLSNIQTMVIDYRLFEGREQFVFINPEDVTEDDETSSGR